MDLNDIYRILASDKDESVRTALAGNKLIDYHIQSILIGDESERVIESLIFNKSLDERLSKDDRLISHKKTAKNYHQKREIMISSKLSKLEKDNLYNLGNDDAYIVLASDVELELDDQKKLQENISRLVTIDGDNLCPFKWSKVAFLNNKNAENQSLRLFEKEKDEEVLKALASNKSCPLDMLGKLLKKKTNIRICIANPDWYEFPPFINSLINAYKQEGIDGLVKKKEENIQWHEKMLKNSYKESDKKSHLLQIERYKGLS